MRDDLTELTMRIQEDLREIARMFAEAGHYHTAIQVQGFATLIAEESSAIGCPAVVPCGDPVKVDISR